MSSDKAFIQLDTESTATVLSYNVPEPTSYYAASPLKLKIDDSYFKPECFVSTADQNTGPLGGILDGIVLPQNGGIMQGGGDTGGGTDGGGTDGGGGGGGTGGIVPPIGMGPLIPEILEELEPKVGTTGAASSERRAVSKEVIAGFNVRGKIKPAYLNLTEMSQKISEGNKVMFYETMGGTINTVYKKYLTSTTSSDTVATEPRIYVTEIYRISSYLGAYGAGRVVQTFSLLPGESTKISMKTYKSSSTTSSESMSVLDSYSEETLDEFETMVQEEASTSASSEDSFEYYADASAKGSASAGLYSAEVEVSGGVSGSTDTARTDQTSSINNAVNKQSTQASAKRDVQVNTSSTTTTTETEETSIEREIENINVSRTLNFVFRQMNQEFHTVTHLVDVKIGYVNGDPNVAQTVSIGQVDTLLDAVINTEEQKKTIKNAIKTMLTRVVDYDGNIVTDFLQEKTYTEAQSDGSTKDYTFWNLNRKLVSTYTSPTTGVSFTIPGIILGVTTNTMRTDGVMVEALLGQSEALDEYNLGLQKQKVEAETLANTELRLETKEHALALDIVERKDDSAAQIFATVCPPETTSDDTEEDA